MRPIPPLLPLFAALALSARGAQLDVLTVEGKTLQGNPLGDPARRRVAVVAPDAIEKTKPLPLILYLPGWGGSSEDMIPQRGGGWIGDAVDALAAKGHPVRIAVVDGRSRYGGSQYLNSSATGNYADYVAEEVLTFVREKYGVAARPVIAGHSSGGYGAVMLAIRRHETFGAVVGLSPDSDFETTHKPLVQDAAVRAVPPAEVAAAMAPAKDARRVSGLAGLVLGLCANYTPLPGQPGIFEWLYGPGGEWRPAVWARWIACDPLTVVQEQKDAFAPGQRIYLDGAELDEFGANIGAAKIEKVLKARGATVQFYQPAGHHGEHLAERLARGVTWVLGQ
ncbi:MAG TPA: alpha/beta fold hydrolase [Chthoniobacteraceae bacterium]|jgi:S-formylglutathione hydrolase FrmB|nr:alpha/beta fold hydrolase [Chthoniobacteraceae bacterium]